MSLQCGSVIVEFDPLAHAPRWTTRALDGAVLDPLGAEQHAGSGIVAVRSGSDRAQVGGRSS